jgi:NAD(P)H-hydrate epimerase
MDIPTVQATELPVVSVEQMAEADRIMIEEIGIALLQMMENAGRNIAELTRSLLGGSLEGQRVAVLAGPGHNGGGGLVSARHLSNWGATVDVILGADESRLKPTTAMQLGILQKMEIPIRPSSAVTPGTYALLIDALLGYSTKGAPRGEIATLIAAAVRAGTAVLALDLPSGLDPDTGRVMSPHITARATLTLAAPKAGLLAPEAQAAVGDLYVGDISVPGGVYAQLGLTAPGAMFDSGPIVRVMREAPSS